MNKKFLYLIALLWVMGSSSLFAQATSERNSVVNLTMKNARLSEVVSAIRKQMSLDFFYSVDELNKYPRISVAFKSTPLEAALKEVLKGTNLQFSIDQNVVVISPNPSTSASSTNTVRINQVVQVRGVVSNAAGVPLSGATVFEKGKNNAVTTKEDGSFSMQSSPGSTLVISFVGYRSSEVIVEKDQQVSTLSVRLIEVEGEMAQVVITGYQSIEKRNLVGSVTTVDAEKIKIPGVNNLDRLLQGQLAGVAVANNSGLVGNRPRTRVRGTSTLLGNQEPIWVVDGIIQEDPLPFEYQEFNALQGETNAEALRNFIGGAVSFLNVEDIQDISVLKDAAAAAIYGVRAANGVIVITTKRGRIGKPQVSYSTNLTVSEKPGYNQFNLMNSKERIGVSREIYERGLSFNSVPDDLAYEGLLRQLLNKRITEEEFVVGVQKLETNNTDWFDLLYRTPFSQNHNISVSGGADRTTYYGSVGLTNQLGNTIGNDQKRYNANLRINTSLRENLRLDFKVSGAFSQTNGLYRVNPFSFAFNTSRAIPAFNEDGSPFYFTAINNASLTGISSGFAYNVLNERAQTGNRNNINDVDLSAGLEYKFLKNFTYNMLFGAGVTQTTAESFASEQSNFITGIRGYEYGTTLPGTVAYNLSRLPLGGQYNLLEQKNSNYTFRNTLSYSTRLRNGADNISVMVGEETRSSKYDGFAQTNYGYMPDRGRTFARVPPTITSGTTLLANTLLDETRPVVTDRLSNYFSLFATATYNFNNRYVINSNIRTDASNRFGQNANYRFKPVWSIGGKWNIAEESWFEKTSWLNNLALRGTIGFQGNVAENYSPDLIARIPQTGGVNSITGEPILTIQSLAYPNLRWEKSRSVNVGLDFSFFNNRVSGSFEYYNRKTTDAIVLLEIPLEYGLSTMPINGGNLLNEGYDFVLNVVPISKKEFNWNMSLNSGRNFNRVRRSGSQSRLNWNLATSGSMFVDGFPVSSFWAFDFAGLDPQTGIPFYDGLAVGDDPSKALNITRAMIYAGQMQPKLTGGIGQNLRYKNFTLNAFFNVSLGANKFMAPIFDNMYRSAPHPYQNVSSEMLNRWRAPGDERTTQMPSIPTSWIPNTIMPTGANSASPYQMYDYSDLRIVNASFVRLNNLSLGWMVPTAALKNWGLKSAQVRLSGSNLFYIASSKLNGQDPEVFGNNLPFARSYSFSLNVGF